MFLGVRPLPEGGPTFCRDSPMEKSGQPPGKELGQSLQAAWGRAEKNRTSSKQKRR